MMSLLFGSNFIVAAVIMSLFYAIGCFVLFMPGQFYDMKPLQLIQQVWLNGAGAMIGWLSLYMVIEHGWPWPALMLAFIGITGHLPWLVVNVILAVERSFKPRGDWLDRK